MDDTKIKKKLWISISVITASIVLAVAALSFFAGDLDAHAQKIVNDKQEGAAQANALAQLAVLEGQVPKADAYSAAFDQLLPDQNGLVGFGQWLNGIAAKDSVNVSMVFGTDVVSPKGAVPGTADFSITISGSLDHIISFLNDAGTRSPGYLFNFTSYNVTGTSGSDYNLTAQGVAYFRS